MYFHYIRHNQCSRGSFSVCQILSVCAHNMYKSPIMNNIPQPIYFCSSKIIQISSAKSQRLSKRASGPDSVPVCHCFHWMTALLFDVMHMSLLNLHLNASRLSLTWYLFESDAICCRAKCLFCLSIIWQRVTKREYTHTHPSM